MYMCVYIQYTVYTYIYTHITHTSMEQLADLHSSTHPWPVLSSCHLFDFVLHVFCLFVASRLILLAEGNQRQRICAVKWKGERLIRAFRSHPEPLHAIHHNNAGLKGTPLYSHLSSEQETWKMTRFLKILVGHCSVRLGSNNISTLVTLKNALSQQQLLQLSVKCAQESSHFACLLLNEKYCICLSSRVFQSMIQVHAVFTNKHQASCCAQLRSCRWCRTSPI